MFVANCIKLALSRPTTKQEFLILERELCVASILITGVLPADAVIPVPPVTQVTVPSQSVKQAELTATVGLVAVPPIVIVSSPLQTEVTVPGLASFI